MTPLSTIFLMANSRKYINGEKNTAINRLDPVFM